MPSRKNFYMPMWDQYQRQMIGFLKWHCWVAFFDFYAQLILIVFNDLGIELDA